jgi:hypothetical protein
MVKIMTALFTLLSFSSCSIFGIQSEESPKYKVLEAKGEFEIREYSSYIIAKTTVKGDYDESSGEAFKILAGYIFGKNKTENKISMTSPVLMKNEPQQIAMTSPVVMNQTEDSFSMTFSMPSKYTLENLPEPLDKRIKFEKVEVQIIASHRFSWFSSKKKNNLMAKELRDWLKNFKNYRASEGHSFAGYNPPWTLPFLKRNEVHIILSK